MQIYNSQTRKLEPFEPQDEKRVTLYVCGPTVYAAPHIGNARPAVVFDQFYRTLRNRYGQGAVVYARNYTDVDDKIIDAANSRSVEISTVTDDAIARYERDMSTLNVLIPDITPRATQTIDDMQAMIQTLLDRNIAYEVNGEVLFHVPANTHQGLANHGEDALRSGNRVAVDAHKRDPRDFVLWKPSKAGEPGWTSPWGEGRPGWHIECSAMIRKHLGVTIDVHGGGADLRFPHHDAECAQSQCAHDQPLARYWMHNGLLTVNGQKMSKSLGNMVYVDDLLTRYEGEVIRYAMLLTHYRSPLDWTHQRLNTALRGLNGLYRTLEEWEGRDVPEMEPISGVVKALENDLNTPAAISELHRLDREITEQDNPVELVGQLRASGILLGLFSKTPEEWFKKPEDSEEIERLVAARNEARAQRNWAEADRIRDQLAVLGVTVADSQHGTEWRKT